MMHACRAICGTPLMVPGICDGPQRGYPHLSFSKRTVKHGRRCAEQRAYRMMADFTQTRCQALLLVSQEPFQSVFFGWCSTRVHRIS